MQLQRVVLYENGMGHFERGGHLTGETLGLDFARGELDDVLKTLTVIDRLGAGVATVDVPALGAKDKTIHLGVRMSAGRVHDLKVSYAVPTPTWKAAYRVVMDDGAKDAPSLLQAWAMVNNASQEDWRGVALTLATGAPMSFVQDLHTPQYVSRPDLNGNMVAPALGPIDDENAGAYDHDNDGIPDARDQCPDSPEDRDQLDDDDGCPDLDNDKDRIPDRDDKCPNEPETYNGIDDEDGCPDRGRVVVTDTSIEVLDQIYFTKGSDKIKQPSLAILDAIAATLKGNPDIRRLEVGGHTSAEEADVWGLASRRAVAVREALVSRGIEASRLVIVPYGATQPMDSGNDESGREHNRRVSFMIAERREVEPPPARTSRPAPTKIDTRTAQASVHTATSAAEVAGMVRYELSEPISIRKGTSSMVSILNKPIAAHDVYLFRPDPNAPGSDRHPFRAVQLINDSGFMLEPGPIAIFARGAFVGDSMIHRLALGETAWVPYAVDGATTVTVDSDDSERPVRIVAIQRGVMTVENAGIHTTRYTIAAGREPAHQIYLRHDKLAGYTAKDLPPGTIDRGDTYLVPLPLQPGKTSVLTVEEREPRKTTLTLLAAGATQIGLYVEGSHLPEHVVQRLRTVMELRAAMGKLEESIQSHRDRLADIADRADQQRENLRALEKVRSSDDVKKKLVASLAQTSADSDVIARQLGADSEALVAARDKLQDALREITLDESAPLASMK